MAKNHTFDALLQGLHLTFVQTPGDVYSSTYHLLRGNTGPQRRAEAHFNHDRDSLNVAEKIGAAIPSAFTCLAGIVCGGVVDGADYVSHWWGGNIAGGRDDAARRGHRRHG